MKRHPASAKASCLPLHQAMHVLNFDESTILEAELSISQAIFARRFLPFFPKEKLSNFAQRLQETCLQSAQSKKTVENALLTLPAGPAKGVECSPVWSEADCKCDIRICCCRLLWPDANGGACRWHCPSDFPRTAECNVAEASTKPKCYVSCSLNHIWLMKCLHYSATSNSTRTCSLVVRRWKIPFKWWKATLSGMRGLCMETRILCLSCSPVEHARPPSRLGRRSQPKQQLRTRRP